METLKFGVVSLAIVGVVCMALENNAHSEPLHHEVQVVTGGRVDAQAFANAVRAEIAPFLRGKIEIYVQVTPHPGATTVAVTIVAERLNRGNVGRVRFAIEAVPRKRGIVWNGYTAVRQRPSFGYADRR